MKKLSILLSLAITAGALGRADAAGPSGPLASLKKSNEEVRKLLKKPAAKGSDAEKEMRSEVKKIVNNFIDYGELARRALGAHWPKISGEQQKEFVSVLRDLIESNYVKQLRSNVDYDMKYEGEELKGGEAVVHSIVKARRNNREESIPIDYKMSKQDGKWLVFDVITDEVSLVRNYKAQFSKIIDKDGFDGLLKKMKKKLAEQQKEA
jgi:phospholipid transport system substrate-binding protein